MDKKIILATLLLLGLALAACGGRTVKADAGPDMRVPVGQQVHFDASGSIGDIANCRWTVLEPPATMAGDAGKIIRDSASDCVFTLDEEMAREYVGEWLIQLEVTDRVGNRATDTVTIEVIP